MGLFEPYTPDDARPRYTRVVIREARDEDVAPVARIAQARNSGDLEKHATFLRGMLPDERHLLLVAERDGVLLAYGKASYLVFPEGSPANTAPEGWYLTGVVVVPEHRRRGVGAELTRARLAWIGRRSGAAYYCASAKNRTTHDLHAPHGFAEVTRDFSLPGVTFTGGGILFRAELA